MIRNWLFVFGVTLGSLATCRPAPGEPSLPRKAIDCTAQAVASNWATAYPHVMTCLTSVIQAPMTCLDIIPHALDISLEVVACVVRYAGNEAAAGMTTNPADTVNIRKAERAKSWLDSHGLEFQ